MTKNTNVSHLLGAVGFAAMGGALPADGCSPQLQPKRERTAPIFRPAGEHLSR